MVAELAEPPASPPTSPPPPAPRRAASASELLQRRQKRFDDFLDRQMDRKTEMRRKLTKMQTEFYNQEKAQDETMLRRGLDGFLGLLVRRYGTVAAAWRVLLDPQNFGKMSFADLCERCNRLGFNGNLKELWTDLDSKKSGFVTLAALDPAAHAGLTEFHTALRARYGGTVEAWRQFLNPRERVHSLPEDVFVERCFALGLKTDGHKLFTWLRTSLNRKELTLEDIDPTAYAALSCADPCAESIGGGTARRLGTSPMPKAALSPLAAARLDFAKVANSRNRDSTDASEAGSPRSRAGSPTSRTSPKGRSVVSRALMLSQSLPSLAVLGNEGDAAAAPPAHRSPTRASMWMRQVAVAQIAELEASRAEHEDADLGMRTVEDFKDLLVRRYGSLLAGWLFALDPLAKGQIFFMEFTERVRALGYLGDTKRLWSELGAAQPKRLQLCNLDWKADQLLNEFREKLCARYGNMLKAWLAAFDPKDLGYVTKDMFVRQCLEAGYKGNAKKLFSLLQDKTSQGDRQCKYLSMREFDLKAFKAHNREDREMVTELAHKVSPIEMSFEERQDHIFSLRWKKVQSALVREDYAKWSAEERAADLACSTLEGVKAFLTNRYGNLATGWRVALDPHRRGHLTKEEFSKAFRLRVGYRGDIQELWNKLAVSNPNYITLHDLDPAAADLMWAFWEFLLRSYGTLVLAWKGLDTKRIGRLEEKEFSKRVAELGFEGDGHRLFGCLRSGPHKTYIALADIDPGAAEAQDRQDHLATTLHGTRGGGPGVSPRLWAPSAEKLGVEVSPLRRRSQQRAAAPEEAQDEQPTEQPLEEAQAAAESPPTQLEQQQAVDAVPEPQQEEDQRVAPQQEEDQKVAPDGEAEEATKEQDTDPNDEEPLKEDQQPEQEQPSPPPEQQQQQPPAQTEEQPKPLEEAQLPPGTPMSYSFVGVAMESKITGDTRLSEWSRELGRRQRKAVADLGDERWEATRAVKGLPDFRKALSDRFRTSAAAWRTAIDPELLNQVTYSQFFLALDRLGGLNSKLKKLWSELDPENRGYFTLKDFDSGVNQDITDFREDLLGKFVSLELAWKDCIGTGRAERIDKDTFVKRCSLSLTSRWKKTNLEHIFTLLLPAPMVGRALVIQEDLELLLVNVPIKERQALRVAPPKPLHKSGLLATVLQTSLAPLTTKKSGGNHNEIPSVTVADLHKILKTQFGSVFSGWVRYLDVTETGKLPEPEFASRAKDIGVVGNVHNLFQIIDRTGKGYITLQDLDAEVHHSVSSFFKQAEEKYGSLSACWRHFDVGGKGYANKQEFREGCSILKYGGDAERLFDLLRPEKDRCLLFLADLGPQGRREHRKNSSQTTKVCNSSHPLKIYISPLKKNVEHVCDGCNRQGIRHPEPTFRCEECNFGLCQKCFGSEKPKKRHPRGRRNASPEATNQPRTIVVQASGKADRPPLTSAGRAGAASGLLAPPFWHVGQQPSEASSYAPSEASDGGRLD